ncbi:NTF2-like protein, partial [Coprinopsis marcescibilis]
DSIELATRAADHFTRIYYSTYDSDTRVVDLPQFYRPTSSLTWNGKPFQGADGLRQLVENMPPTKHEVQSFDCHPIPGSQPPSLLISVSGNVTHGKGPAGNPPNTAKTIDGQPRVFHQVFMLVPDTNAPPTKPGEVAKYFIGADALRFVG